MIINPPKDGYTTTRHASEKLNALSDKSVFIKFIDGSVACGFLHIDTLATFANCPEYDNKRIIGYYLETPTRRIHFKKSAVKRIKEA